MSRDKTISAPGQPKFGIGEVAYARSSALLGFIESIVIAKVRFDHPIGAYVYRWLRDSSLETGLAAQAKEKDLAPFELREEAILTLCETLPIHISVIGKELEKAEEQLEDFPGGVVVTKPVPVETRGRILQPPEPRFGVNEVVYLIDSAEINGRLEKMRIDSLEFNNESQEWEYTAIFRKKPGENATVGDRNDLRRSVVVNRPESQLGTIADVLPLRVDFLTRALNASTRRFDNTCQGSEV